MKSKKIATISILYLNKGAALFIGPVMDNEFHKHHAIQVTFGIDKSFLIHFKDQKFRSKSLIINSDIEHKLIGKTGTQALLLIEPESHYGQSIQNKITDKYRFFDFDDDFNKSITKLLFSGQIAIHKIISLLFDNLNISIIPVKIEERVSKAIDIIEKCDEKKITVKKLAAQVFLSESRLQHMFKNQVGISIKQYLLWKRMIDGIQMIVYGNDFTFSAHESGFADSSHMSRTFKDMFGIKLSEIFKNSRSIQVISENN